MIDYTSFFKRMSESALSPWVSVAQLKTQSIFTNKSHGNLNQWLKVLEDLPQLSSCNAQLNQDIVTIESQEVLSKDLIFKIESELRKLHPWRKGPFDVFGVHIDTEWHSDWKWNRVKKYVQPLKDKIVLDIGCGSGYHVWRMLGEGAKLAIGLDPTLLFVMQFYALQKYINNDRAAVLPLGTDDLPEKLEAFDTVFSMGLLYHRRAPLDHLFQVFNALKPGGELVLETLVVEGDAGYSLMPEDRYAKMPNVFFLPTLLTLEAWIKKMKFEKVLCCDVNQTTLEEQRSTDWMRFESLIDYLDPGDANKTIEGYPAPKRAIFTAQKPF